MKPKLKKIITPIGRSVQGQSIEAYRYGSGGGGGGSSESDPLKVLIMSGLHGDEVEGIMLNNQLASALINQTSALLKHIAFLPIANPDAYHLHQRWNANDVDLNRNFAAQNWSATILNPRYPPGPSAASEPETKAVSQYILESQCQFVLDLHSYKQSAILPLYQQTSDALNSATQALAKEQNLKILSGNNGLGYETTGGLEAWCFDHKINNLTIEIEKGLGQFAILDRYCKPLVNFLNQIIEPQA